MRANRPLHGKHMSCCEFQTELDAYRLQACYEEDPQEEMSQLEMWSAYEETFLALELPLLITKDYITIISQTFPTVKVGTYTIPESFDTPKHVIQGLRVRDIGQAMIPSTTRLSELYVADSPVKDPRRKRKYASLNFRQAKKSKRSSQAQMDQDEERHDPLDFISEGDDRTHRRKAREEDELKAESIELDY
jgi:hypothetical protein